VARVPLPAAAAWLPDAMRERGVDPVLARQVLAKLRA
jgi:hypothetical protein